MACYIQTEADSLQPCCGRPDTCAGFPFLAFSSQADAVVTLGADGPNYLQPTEGSPDTLGWLVTLRKPEGIWTFQAYNPGGGDCLRVTGGGPGLQ